MLSVFHIQHFVAQRGCVKIGTAPFHISTNGNLTMRCENLRFTGKAIFAARLIEKVSTEDYSSRH